MAGFFKVNTRTSNARRFADQLIAQGSQTTPVATPLAAVARAVQGLTGGFVQGQENRAEESLASRQQQALIRALAPQETGPGGLGGGRPKSSSEIIQAIGQIEGADPATTGALAVQQALAQDKARTDARSEALKFQRDQGGREQTATTLAARQRDAATTAFGRQRALAQEARSGATSEFDRLRNETFTAQEVINDPNASPRARRRAENVVTQNNKRMEKLTTVTGTTEQDPSFTSSQVGKRIIALEDDERAVAGLVRGADRVFKLLDEETEIGFTGALVSAANSFASQSKAAAKAAGKIFVDEETGKQLNPDKLLDPKRYNFGELSKLGQDASRVKATMMSLAFGLASQQNKGRISDRDVQAALTQLGGDVGDKDTFKAILRDRIKDTIADHNLRRQQVEGDKFVAKDFGFNLGPETTTESVNTVPVFNVVGGKLVPQ